MNWKALGNEIIRQLKAAKAINDAAEVARLERVKQTYADTVDGTITVALFRQQNNI